jgi:hypothetical protein
MPSSIDELDREIRDLLHRKADGLEVPEGSFERTVRRSNRRLIRNGLACLLVLGLVGSGAAVGVRSLAGSPRTTPAERSPVPPAGSVAQTVQVSLGPPQSMTTVPLGLAGGDGVVWVASGGNIGFPPMIGVLSDPNVDVGEATLTRIQARTGPPFEVTGVASIGKGEEVGVVAAFGDAWVLRPASDTVVRFDGSSLEKAATIAVPNPIGAAADGNSVWVVSYDGTLTRIDPRTNQVVATIETGVPHVRGFENDVVRPQESPNNGVPVTGIAAGDGSVWVRGGGRLVRVDPATNSVEAMIDVGGTIEGLAEGDSSVWVSVCTPAVPPCTWELMRIDTTTNAIAERHLLGTWDDGVGRAAVTFDSGSVWVALAVTQDGYSRGRLLQIDPASGDVMRSFEVSGSLGTNVGGTVVNSSDVLGPVVIESGGAWVINIESDEVVRVTVSGP